MQRKQTALRMAINHPSRISPLKAMELANLILISYYRNLKFVESMSEYRKEPTGLFTDSLMCCDHPGFNEESPEHHASQSYKVESWIWSTEQMGPLHRFMHRTLPFGFIATNEPSRELFIILRGTITSYEWKNNLIVTPASSIEGAANLGKVHSGFNHMFNATHKKVSALHAGRFTIGTGDFYGAENTPSRSGSIKGTIAEYVLNADWHRKGYRIFIAGHSLGGALAMLSGFYLLTHDYEAYHDILSICTFGAPRVGNQDFCNWFDGVDVVRYFNTEDAVPTVPPPTASLFGSDMNETNNEKVIALKEDGYRRFDGTYGVTKGLTYNFFERSNDELARSKAYVHTGEHRSFTLNKGSISYNHNMKESYREGIKMFASK
jgi:hypothetical protein